MTDEIIEGGEESFDKTIMCCAECGSSIGLKVHELTKHDYFIGHVFLCEEHSSDLKSGRLKMFNPKEEKGDGKK